MGQRRCGGGGGRVQAPPEEPPVSRVMLRVHRSWVREAVDGPQGGNVQSQIHPLAMQWATGPEEARTQKDWLGPGAHYCSGLTFASFPR